MNNLFDRQKTVGKVGELKVIEYFQRQNKPVKDVSNIRQYQNIDVDLIADGLYIEVKTSNTIQYKNSIVFELVSDMNYCREGWFETSQADIFIFYSPQQNKLYKMTASSVRDFYNTNSENIKQYEYTAIEHNGYKKTSLLAEISVCDLLQNTDLEIIQL